VTAPILVLEATSCVGRGVVEAAVAAGRPVIAAALDHPALLALKSAHPRAELTLLPGGAGDDATADALAADLRELGRPLGGIVVAALHEPAGGRVLEQTSVALRRVIEQGVLPQLAAARALLPLLAEGGRSAGYVVIGGPGGEQHWAGYGQHSIAGAANRMLLRVLHDEARALGVRVQLLAVDCPAKTELNRERACAHWPDTRAIGEQALALVDRRDATRPAEAIVRFAWPQAPSQGQLAERRLVPAPVAARVAAAGTGLPPAQRRALEDTWSLLQPLLNPSDKKKAPTP
jgi:NAD(P)-dependent dehydrogenase (short-subunit alcohol dehydrogenase family)